MAKKIKKGDDLPVKVDLEFEGTIRSALVTVESQTIPLKGSTKKSGQRTIEADRDPINLEMIFNGDIGAVVKKHQITINSVTYQSVDEFKMKFEQVTIKVHIPYIFFNMIDVTEVSKAPEGTLVV